MQAMVRTPVLVERRDPSSVVDSGRHHFIYLLVTHFTTILAFPGRAGPLRIRTFSLLLKVPSKSTVVTLSPGFTRADPVAIGVRMTSLLSF